MTDKYKMSQKENIFLAKRLLVDVIYKSANLEGIDITFTETVNILNDVNAENIKPSEIGKVCCLRDAWQYIIEHISDNVDLGYIENVHTLVTKTEMDYKDLGQIRTRDVIISGTTWRPEIPNPETLHKELKEILSIENVTNRALTVMLWIMRNQIFVDGNKRVATMIGNKILIENGNGIISVPVELDGKFKTLLVKYYETNDMEEIKQWMYDNCIDGVNT